MNIKRLKEELNTLIEKCEERKNIKSPCSECEKNMDCGVLCGVEDPKLFLTFLDTAEGLKMLGDDTNE